MARDLFNRYIWIIDTIQRYKSITRDELNELWMRTAMSEGNPLPRRTFYSYRNAIFDMFNIKIECSPSTFEYYIASGGTDQSEKMLNWVLDSASMSGMLSSATEVQERIMLEDVPSARVNLPVVIDAIKNNHPIEFTYKPYSRVNPSKGVVLEPYSLRLYKQLWYVIGHNVKDEKIKTYSLDRMTELHMEKETFEMPDFDIEEYFKDCFGIMTSRGEVKDVMLRVEPNQAKYFRALPLHHSQAEQVHDKYSLFTYRLYLTNDFVREILSYGNSVEVVSPPELKAMVVERLKATMALYK